MEAPRKPRQERGPRTSYYQQLGMIEWLEQPANFRCCSTGCWKSCCRSEADERSSLRRFDELCESKMFQQVDKRSSCVAIQVNDQGLQESENQIFGCGWKKILFDDG